ncbi:MAG: hypothetical protein M1372_01265 [Patescibacteria group bacterium]|nr:hypothetical protein [Patescibacteria group bacterium]
MTEALREYQALSDNLSASIRQFTLEAKPVRLLSDSDDKKVELVEDRNGNRVIRRTYSPSVLRDISRSGLNFNTAYNAMHQEYDSVGITVVPSFVINPYDSNSGYPIAVVAEYLEGSEPVYFASTETKKEICV